MPQQRDTASDRLQDHINNEGNGIARQLGIIDDAVVLGSAYRHARMNDESDWRNLDKRAIAADQATTIDANDATLKKAFDKFGLQPQNPFHWRKLIYYFADAHFGTEKRVGRRAIWSDVNLCLLLQDFGQVERRFQVAPGSNVNELRLCGLLKSHFRFKERYSKFSAKTLHRNLQRARNPKHNKILNGVVSEMVEKKIACQQKPKRANRDKVDPKMERMARSAVLPKAIQLLSSRAPKDPIKLFEAVVSGVR